MTTSPSTRITGTVVAPLLAFCISSNAASSDVTSLFVKGTPFAVRNSLTALHDPQVGDEYTTTFFVGMSASLSRASINYFDAPFIVCTT